MAPGGSGPLWALVLAVGRAVGSLRGVFLSSLSVHQPQKSACDSALPLLPALWGAPTQVWLAPGKVLMGGVVLEAFTLESSQLIWGGSWGLVFLPLPP